VVGWHQNVPRWTEDWLKKCRKPYAPVMTYIRTKLKSAPLRSTLAANTRFSR